MALRLSDLTDEIGDRLRQASAYVDDFTTPTLRLGVTGLSRAGKTVFITALVRTLTEAGAQPPISVRRLDGFRAFLEPQPDDSLPRFGYEEHLAALSAEPAHWPESTRHISQLRVTLEWHPQDWLRQAAGIQRRLHVDLIDYPGEWLADVGLLEQDYDTWARHVGRIAVAAPAGAARNAWVAFYDEIADPSKANERSSTDAEQTALRGARLFTAHLNEQKLAGRLAPSAGPGRFLMPGDYDGSPLLTFFPMPEPTAGQEAKSGALRALLVRRYESYKSVIVRPFFEKHFSRIERQIVLVDVLGALNLGPAAVLEMENALERALHAFRPGRDSWLGRLMGQRVDSILFAATKADHLNQRNHDRLRAILRKVVNRAQQRADEAGARIDYAAIAALRTTEDVERATRDGEPEMMCVRGVPLDGQVLGGKPLDPTKALTVFPGDLPADPLDAFDPDILPPGSLSFVRFRPRLTLVAGDGDVLRWPHAGLDRVVTFLLGDRLK